MKILRLTILSLIPVMLFCQARLPDKHYTTHDGLPQIQVMDMLQDSRGYIWVATKKGIARFNGERFTKVELPLQNINHLYEDDKGRLYFFTTEKSGTVLQYDGKNFKQLTIDKNLLHRSYLNKIKDNQLFVVTNTKEVLVYDLDSFEQQKSIFLPDTVNTISKLANDRLVGFHRPDRKIFDIETKELIYEVEKPYSFNIKQNQRGQENILVRKLFDKGREMQIIDLKFDAAAIVFQRKAPNYSVIQDLDLSNNNSYVFLTSKDEVLLASGQKVINTYKVSNTTRVICLLDVDDNLWISHENGIEFFSKSQIETLPIELVSDAWSFLPYKNKHIYSSYSKGIFNVDLETKEKKPIYLPRIDRLNYGASLDKKGNLYLPGNASLYQYDGNKFKSYPLENIALITYYNNSSEQLVVGGYKSIGLLGPDDEKIKYYPAASDSILSRYVVSLHARDQHSYWVGTYRDLAVFDSKNESYTSYNHLFPQDSAGAVSLAVDPKTEKLWIGNTKGLWCYDSKAKSLNHIGKESFQDEYISSLLVLPNQILAIGTSNGFSILNLREYNEANNVVIKTFNHRNGFLGEEVAQSGLVLDGTTLYIPSATYLSYVDINNLTFEEDYASIVISELNGQTLPWGSSETIKLPDSQNNVSISFEGLGFNKPHETRYSYYLENVDSGWSPWGTESKVNYTNLSSGKYNFRVKSQTSNLTFKNKNPNASLAFELDLPIYKEPNFYKYASLLLLALTLLSFYLFWRYRKTKNVTIFQDQQIKYLEIQALRSQMNPHFIFNVLGTIQALILDKQTEEANKYLVSFSKLIRRFLDASVSSNIDTDNINIDNTVSLGNEIELIKLYVEFELLQYKDKFDFVLEIQDKNLSSLQIPPMIIQPFVENAIKHGLLNKDTKGKLLVAFQISDDGLHCVIDDNGVGRENARLLQQNSINLYTSRGTALVFQRVELLNSLSQNITINTIDKLPPQTGTRVEIIFTKKSIA